MRAILDVLQFEIRYQLRSPFFLGAVQLFALIHFLAITGLLGNIDISNQIAINSTYFVLQMELVLFLFGMLPILAFVTTAITRDFEHATESLVYVTPISPRSFVLGRFLGALSLSLLIGLAGLIGTMLGTFMPWLDPARIDSFSIEPWAFTFLFMILPGTFVLCSLFFSVAALTRSFALTYGAAIAFFVSDLFLNAFAMMEPGGWAALADPSARLAVTAATRFLTVAELNMRPPMELLLQNRLLWMTAALLVLLLTLPRFRLDLAERVPFRFKRRTPSAPLAQRTIRGAVQPVNPMPNFSLQASFAQFASQLRMDLSAVFKSPLIYIILVLAVTMLAGESQGNVIRIFPDYPLYPLTSLMLPFLSMMIQLILIVGIWYSADLIHRERAFRICDIVHSSPYPDWLMILSKTAAICLVVNAVMLVAVVTLTVLQSAAGYFNFELGLYLQSAFVYNGMYFCMLCTLAMVIQTIAPNKWLGMLVTLSVYAGLLSLPALGYDHMLYNFNFPVIYSDMNGFGHFQKPALWLVGYWGSFCVLLLVAAHLLCPRGNYSGIRERLRDARIRIRTGVRLTSCIAASVFLAIGCWIFYNTNIINKYLAQDTRLKLQAGYEKAYSRYEAAPTPSFDSIHMAIDIFPEERRLESRGRAIMGNHKKEPIREFAVSLNPTLQVNRIEVENAVPVHSNIAQGFYLYRLNAALAPGETVTMTWNVTRRNDGFVASNPDPELVANGSYISNFGVMPIPGYDGWRRITDNAQRRRYGLPSAPRMAPLGDPAHSDRVALGVDSRTAFEIVLSTSADQIAVAPGVLLKEWRQGSRRYFHYRAEEPILPNLSFCSARYAVARDRWNGVALEIYHDPKHPFNIPAIMETAKLALDYYSREYAPYQYSYLRILEYARYRSAAQFQPGIIPCAETTGFVTDLRAMENADPVVMHELAHMWWADRIAGAQMQGRWMLTENMAEYSRLMLFKEYYPAFYANQIARGWHDGYLNGRKAEDEEEVPVMYTENHVYLRGKGPLAMYALQDVIGKEKMHQALRNFLKEFSFQTSPCPTSRDLVNALRVVAGPEYQQFITDLFERIVLYDLSVNAARARPVAGGYDVTAEVSARQFSEDGHGNGFEEPLDAWFDVAVFPETREPLDGVTPLYIGKHRLRTGNQSLTVRTPERPGIVALDPFHKRIERSEANNRRTIE
jgi:ABC-type transport system involved in multi-copper enzyme maturation permease subunit